MGPFSIRVAAVVLLRHNRNPGDGLNLGLDGIPKGCKEESRTRQRGLWTAGGFAIFQTQGRKSCANSVRSLKAGGAVVEPVAG